jgi:hypothetical protein
VKTYGKENGSGKMTKCAKCDECGKIIGAGNGIIKLASYPDVRDVWEQPDIDMHFCRRRNGTSPCLSKYYKKLYEKAIEEAEEIEK